MSILREGGGIWNVENVLHEQRPLLSNRLAKDKSLEKGLAARMGLRNMVAAPMMVSSVPVGVLYAANRRIKSFSHSDMVLAVLIATQVAPVIENALLWERLREAAASEERLRIARDLHDSVLQTLAAIKLHLERCRLLIPKDPSASLDGIGRIHEIATRGLAEVRTYLSELRMVEPEPGRFRQIITGTAEDAAAKGGFSLDLSVDTQDRGMRPEVALAAFQILRELMQNTANHSQAKNVSVRVFTREDKLIMDIADDGVGFDVARTRAVKVSEGHLGLVGVDERARQTDGTFSLTSEPGHGTHAQVTLRL